MWNANEMTRGIFPRFFFGKSGIFPWLMENANAIPSENWRESSAGDATKLYDEDREREREREGRDRYDSKRMTRET